MVHDIEGDMLRTRYPVGPWAGKMGEENPEFRVIITDSVPALRELQIWGYTALVQLDDGVCPAAQL